MNKNMYTCSFVDDPSRISKPCMINKSVAIMAPPDPYRLPYLQAALFATVFEDLLLQFRINMNTSNEWRVTQTLVDYDKLLAIKYGVEQPKVTDELAHIDPSKLNCEEYKLSKLFADKNYLRDVLEETYADLSVDRSFSVLADYVKTLRQTFEHREIVMQDEMKNRQLRRDLLRQTRQLRNHIKSAIYDADCTISVLRTNVEDACLVAETRGRYVSNWQVARTEQNKQRIHNKESMACDKIEFFKQRYDQETRVHTEIELLTNIMLNETLQKIERWMTKYDHDIEIIDLRIQKMRNNHINQKEKREELEQTIEEHDKLMKNWQQFKIDRENARLYREKMNNAAITVQAWWRGFLVRNQLGPYKPPPTKKGAKNDKKKK